MAGRCLLALVLLGPIGCSSPPSVQPPVPVVARPPDYRRGMVIYQSACASCHDGANVEAPPLDDIEAWDERAFDWQLVLRHHTAQGLLNPPADSRLTEEGINDALLYMETRVRAIEEQSHNTHPVPPGNRANAYPG
jgi:cytochrome c5